MFHGLNKKKSLKITMSIMFYCLLIFNFYVTEMLSTCAIKMLLWNLKVMLTFTVDIINLKCCRFALENIKIVFAS